MIKIVIKREPSGKIQSIEVKGHANSAEEGKDLICAAVSGIVIGGFNSLDAGNYEILVQKGHASAKAKSSVSDHDSIVLETILTQLKTVNESHPEYVKIVID